MTSRRAKKKKRKKMKTLFRRSAYISPTSLLLNSPGIIIHNPMIHAKHFLFHRQYLPDIRSILISIHVNNIYQKTEKQIYIEIKNVSKEGEKDLKERRSAVTRADSCMEIRRTILIFCLLRVEIHQFFEIIVTSGQSVLQFYNGN